MKKTIFVILVTLLWGCDGPEVSLIVLNKNSGTILIDGIQLSKKIKEDNSSPGKHIGNYFLDLKKGVHQFEISIADGEKIIKILNLDSGEAYLSVDLISGRTDGFE